MRIKFQCEKCQQTLLASSDKVGQQATSPTCRSRFVVPAEDSSNSKPHPEVARRSDSGQSEKKVSWLAWLFSGEPEHQKTITNNAERSLANISAVLASFERETNRIEHELSQAIEKFWDDSATPHFKIPFPYQLSNQHHSLLEAAHVTRVLRGISASDIETLQQAQRQLQTGIRQKRKAEGLINRAFNRLKAERAIEETCNHLKKYAAPKPRLRRTGMRNSYCPRFRSILTFRR